MHDVLVLLARVMLATFFLVELTDKFRRFSFWVDVVRKARMPAPRAEMALVVFLLSAGTTSILLGLQTTWGIGALLLFLAPTALFFESPAGRVKSISIAGGLIALALLGPGSLSVDGAGTHPQHSSP